MRKHWYWWQVVPLVMALLGGFLRIFYSPVRFTALLLVLAAAAVLLWGWLNAHRAQKPARIALRIVSLLLTVGLTVFAILEVNVISRGRTDWDSQPEAVVILGAGVNGTVPSLSLQVRLEAALDYIAGKPDIPIVVTGSQGPGEDISEAACMAGWLVSHGVEPERIHLEEQADNTEENIRYSKEILKGLGIGSLDGVAVVSADYHLYRAGLYWNGLGFIPVAARMPGRYLPLTVNYYIREAFAVAKSLVLR